MTSFTPSYFHQIGRDSAESDSADGWHAEARRAKAAEAELRLLWQPVQRALAAATRRVLYHIPEMMPMSETVTVGKIPMNSHVL